MIYFLKHFKRIAYFLVMLILFQSCVVYNNNSSTIEEASSEKDMPVKIITKDGDEYKLRWIEEIDGNIVSIKNVEREYINKNEILQIVLLDPEPQLVPLDIAVKHHGTIRLLTKDDKDRRHSHQFIRIRESDERITGYKMTGVDTLSVTIPIDQLEKIQLKNKGKSSGRTAGLIVGLGLGAVFIAWIVAIANEIDRANRMKWPDP